MPTDNPKISGYVPQQIYDRFKQFQEERGLSMSQATVVILAEYFGLEETIRDTTEGITIGGVSLARFEKLEKEIDIIKNKLNSQLVTDDRLPEQKVEQSKSTSGSLKEDKQNFNKKPDKINNKENSQLVLLGELPSSPFVFDRDLLAIRFGFKNSRSVLNSSVKTVQEFSQWSQGKDPDGIAWKKNKLKTAYEYTPLPETSKEQMDKLQEWIESLA